MNLLIVNKKVLATALAAICAICFVKAEVRVANIGKVEGAEVVQAYVRDVKSSVERPQKELKAFCKVTVAPGETTEAVLTLDRNAFAFFNPVTGKWTVEPGKFEILIGTSSQNITAKIPVNKSLTQEWADSQF